MSVEVGLRGVDAGASEAGVDAVGFEKGPRYPGNGLMLLAQVVDQSAAVGEGTGAAVNATSKGETVRRGGPRVGEGKEIKVGK